MLTDPRSRLRSVRAVSTVVAFAMLASVVVPTLAADERTREFLLAARSGDVAKVRSMLEAGVSVDAADDWGTTGLALAAKQGQLDVIRLLLEKGADANAQEEFFYMTVLDNALWKGAPDYEAAKLVVAGGAEDRAKALATGLQTGNAALARAAVESGPIPETEAEQVRARFTSLEGELAEIVAAMRTGPDPAPPAYAADELAAFAGTFGEGDAAVTLDVVEGKLRLSDGGDTVVLTPTGDRAFEDEEGVRTVGFMSRARVIEGVAIARENEAPRRLRRADAPVTGSVDLPEFVEDPNAKPTVHWPGFRGANRAGVGDGVDTPVSFDLETGENVLWRVPLPGLGNSSPVVWGDRVFVTTAVAKGGSTPLRTGLTGAGDEVEEQTEHRWLVLALDKRTGKTLWETEVGRGVPLTHRHFKATQANSTAVTDGKHVVVVFPTAGLACLSVDGKLRWKHELGGLNAGGFNDPGMQWGFAASPILHDGKVVLQVDVHGDSYLAAWKLDDGKPLWKTARPDVAPSWATPAVWPTADGDELVVNASIIRGYDPGDGRELWSLGPTSIQVVASPVIGSENVFVSSGYPPARPIYAVKPGIRGDHLIASDEDAGALAWHLERGGAYMPTPLLYRGLLYIVHHNARIVAHDARTGAPAYKARFSAGGTMTSSPVVANGKIYQGSEEGTLYVLEAGPSYRELAVHELGAPIMATPAISEGIVLVRLPEELIALSITEGAATSAETSD